MAAGWVLRGDGEEEEEEEEEEEMLPRPCNSAWTRGISTLRAPTVSNGLRMLVMFSCVCVCV